MGYQVVVVGKRRKPGERRIVEGVAGRTSYSNLSLFEIAQSAIAEKFDATVGEAGSGEKR
jgi:hypothetical protein